MSPEVSRFRGNSGQAGSDVGHLAFGLIQKRAERDALIDRVVSFGATNRKVTVLETPVAFDSTVIDVTPRSPGAPSGDLSHDLVKNGILSSEVRASSQPQLSEKKKKLGGLRDVAVKGTLFITGAGLAGLVVGACTPAQRAILEGAFPCAPGLIAGAADGNTAAIENPNQITISGNIFDDKKEAKVCLPTGQTVSVRFTPKPTSEIQDMESIIKANHPNGKPTDLADIVDGDLKDAYENPAAETVYPKRLASIHWGDCQSNNKITSHKFLNLKDSCSALFITLYDTFKSIKDTRFYKAALHVTDYALRVLPDKYDKQYTDSLRQNYPQG